MNLVTPFTAIDTRLSRSEDLYDRTVIICSISRYTLYGSLLRFCYGSARRKRLQNGLTKMGVDRRSDGGAARAAPRQINSCLTAPRGTGNESGES